MSETPISQQVAALELRCAAAEAKLARQTPLGDQLATIAYNLRQHDSISEDDKACLRAAQTGWDEARRMT